jgi:short-subunit dehydrogenase
MAQLSDKIIIVTGASAGIGAATARELARHGAMIILAARRPDRLEIIREEISKAGGQSVVIPTDINNPEDRKRLIESTQSKFGRIDGLVNNAGFGQGGPVEMVPIDDIRQQFETNVFSLLALTQLVLPHMRKQQSGRIIIVGSVAGRIARPFSSIYDATKHALEAFSDGMRTELAPFGIQVVLIEPGFIGTEFAEVAGKAAEPIMADKSSPYAPFFEHREATYKQFRNRSVSPQVIADVILQAFVSQKPKSRYAAPGHAKLFLFAKWLLPTSVLDWIWRRQYKLTQETLQSSALSVKGKSAHN